MLFSLRCVSRSKSIIASRTNGRASSRTAAWAASTSVAWIYAALKRKKAMSANALMFTCLTGSRTGEVLGLRWAELDFDQRLWICPAERMKTGEERRVPLTDEMLAILEPLKVLQSDYVFEGQKRHQPLSNMSMLMLLRRMQVEGGTVHGFRSTFRDWAAEVANVPREVAEKSLAHSVGSEVGRAYARSDLLEKRRDLMRLWSQFVTSGIRECK